MGSNKARKKEKSLSKMQTFFHSLFDQVPAHSLVFLRVSWGLVMVSEVYRFMQDDYALAKDLLVDPKFLYKYPGFEWIGRCNMETWKVLLDVMSVCCIAFSLGFLYHLAALIFFTLFTFLFLQDATMYLNHYYLICVLCGVYTFLPANQMFAIDPKLRLATPKQTVPYWSVLVIRVVISIVYIYAGIAKMNQDWIRGEPLLHWVPRRCRMYPSWCWLLKHPATSIAMAWCGLLFDTTCPFFFLMGGMYRKLAFVASTIFHVANMMIFNIGVFPSLMLVISMIYCELDWPLAVLRKFSKNKSLKSPPNIERDRNKPLTRTEKRIIFVLLLFTAIQVFLPIRHLLYPGDVVWNELGHRFSWRMKLRDKVGTTTFYVTPPSRQASTENSRPVKLHRFLTPDQIKRMAGRPDLMFQTIDEIRRRFDFAFAETPQVHVVSLGSVNYRVHQFVLDPTVDFANVTNRQDYIIPFLPRTCDSSCPFAVEELKKKVTGNTGYPPKQRMFAEYKHVGLSEAMEYFENSKTRPMPKNSNDSEL